MSYKITKVETIRHSGMPGPVMRGMLEYDDGTKKFFSLSVDHVPSEDEMRVLIDKHLAEQGA